MCCCSSGEYFFKKSCISYVYLLSVRFSKVSFVLAMTSGTRYTATAELAIRFYFRTSGVPFWEVIDGT